VPDAIAPATLATTAPKGFLGRVIGVLLSPRATYADVAARPRWLGVLVLVALLSACGVAILFSTEVGQRALLDQQVRTMESFGVKMNDAAYDRLERGVGRAPYYAAAGQLVTLPLMALIISGIAIGVFNAAMGEDARFKQVFSIVAHSGVIIALQQLFVLPLDYMRETMSSPTTLAVFLPMLDENSFLAHLLGAVDLFVIWWAVSLSIGLGVLYRRRTAPIATTIILIYVTIGLIIAGIKSALGA